MVRKATLALPAEAPAAPPGVSGPRSTGHPISDTPYLFGEVIAPLPQDIRHTLPPRQRIYPDDRASVAEPASAHEPTARAQLRSTRQPRWLRRTSSSLSVAALGGCLAITGHVYTQDRTLRLEQKAFSSRLADAAHHAPTTPRILAARVTASSDATAMFAARLETRTEAEAFAPAAIKPIEGDRVIETSLAGTTVTRQVSLSKPDAPAAAVLPAPPVLMAALPAPITPPPAKLAGVTSITPKITPSKLPSAPTAKPLGTVGKPATILPNQQPKRAQAAQKVPPAQPAGSAMPAPRQALGALQPARTRMIRELEPETAWQHLPVQR